MRCGTSLSWRSNSSVGKNRELKRLVANLSLEVYHPPKKRPSRPPRRHRYQRVRAAEKAEVLAKVTSLPLSKRKVLRELGTPKSTYCR